MFENGLSMMLFYLGVTTLHSLAVPVPLLVGATIARKKSSSWAPYLLLTGAIIWLVVAISQIGNIFIMNYISVATAGNISIGTGIIKTTAGILFAIGFIKFASEKTP